MEKSITLYINSLVIFFSGKAQYSQRVYRFARRADVHSNVEVSENATHVI